MAAQVIELGKRTIGKGAPVFVIAEVGINHNGDMKLAEELVRAAAKAGADAVKLQTYTTEKRVAKDSPIFGLLKNCELSHEEQKELFGLGGELGVMVFSTPFDEEAVDFLKETGSLLIKVASFDVVNKRLLKKIAGTGLPVIVSRGMATMEELASALDILDSGNAKSAVLHCVSAYPVPSFADLNLSTIRDLEEKLARPAGFSDHTIGISAPVWAVAAGAKIIEKHFTLDTKMEGPDHAISADPTTLREMVDSVREVEAALGSPVSGPIGAEKDILQYRRTTVAP